MLITVNTVHTDNLMLMLWPDSILVRSPTMMVMTMVMRINMRRRLFQVTQQFILSFETTTYLSDHFDVHLTHLPSQIPLTPMIIIPTRRSKIKTQCYKQKAWTKRSSCDFCRQWEEPVGEVVAGDRRLQCLRKAPMVSMSVQLLKHTTRTAKSISLQLSSKLPTRCTRSDIAINLCSKHRPTYTHNIHHVYMYTYVHDAMYLIHRHSMQVSFYRLNDTYDTWLPRKSIKML